MKALMTAAVATALIGWLASGVPARADEDCDNVVKALEEALSIANTNFDQTMDQLKKTMSGGSDDKTKATVKNTFCSVGGEMLGTSLAVARGRSAMLQAARHARFPRQVDQGDGDRDRRHLQVMRRSSEETQS